MEGKYSKEALETIKSFLEEMKRISEVKVPDKVAMGFLARVMKKGFEWGAFENVN